VAPFKIGAVPTRVFAPDTNVIGDLILE